MVSHAHEASGLSGSIPHEASSLQPMSTSVTELGPRLAGQGRAVTRGQTAGWTDGQQEAKDTHGSPRELSTKLPPTNHQTERRTRLLSYSWSDELMWTRWADDTGRAGVWWLGTWGEPGSAKKTTQWGRWRPQKAFNKRSVSCPKAEAHSKKCSTDEAHQAGGSLVTYELIL